MLGTRFTTPISIGCFTLQVSYGKTHKWSKEMKRTINILIGVGTLLFASHSSASTYFNTITNLWYTGHQTNVLQMAETRLAQNTNDVAGVLMKASWDFAFSDAVVLSNSLNRVLNAGETVQSSCFTNVFRITRLDVVCVLNAVANETVAQRTADLAKQNRPGRWPHFIEELKALDADGYFNGE